MNLPGRLGSPEPPPRRVASPLSITHRPVGGAKSGQSPANLAAGPAALLHFSSNCAKRRARTASRVYTANDFSAPTIEWLKKPATTWLHPSQVEKLGDRPAPLATIMVLHRCDRSPDRAFATPPIRPVWDSRAECLLWATLASRQGLLTVPLAPFALAVGKSRFTSPVAVSFVPTAVIRSLPFRSGCTDFHFDRAEGNTRHNNGPNAVRVHIPFPRLNVGPGR